MIVQAPKPSVENLQCEAIALLQEIGFLMDNAARALSADSSSDKYKDFQQEVLGVSRNVEKLELMMAIVAPMKAGKSTIINAIAGQEIVPSRNAAMTTLPTQIVFNPDLAQPTLTLSPEIITVYQQTLQALQTKIHTLGMQRIQDKIAQYPHLQDLLPKIQDPAGLQLQEITSGREEIIKVLMSLNDIVRLCNTIDPATDPLGRLTEVPCIQVPMGRSRSLAQSDAAADSKPDLLGNLVIVDTPGPNEAGENLKLATSSCRTTQAKLDGADRTRLYSAKNRSSRTGKARRTTSH